MMSTLYHVAKSFFSNDKVFQTFAFQFLTQAGYIYSQCIIIHKAVTFPEFCHNCISGDCFSCMFQKDFQNAEFIFGKIYIMSVPGQYAAGRIQDGTFMFQNIPRSPKE